MTIVIFFSNIDNIKTRVKLTLSSLEDSFLEDDFYENFQKDINFYNIELEKNYYFDKLKKQHPHIQWQGNFRAKFSAVMNVKKSLVVVLNNGYFFNINQTQNKESSTDILKFNLSNLDNSYSGGLISAIFIPKYNWYITYSLKNISGNKFLFLSVFDADSLKQLVEHQLTFVDTLPSELGGGFALSGEDLFLNIGVAGTARFDDQAYLALDKDSIFGKTIKIKIAELIKKDKKLSFKIFSSGHKHSQGILFAYKNLFSVEHSINGGDELNILVENGNYGYPEYGFSRGDSRSNRTFMSNKKQYFIDPIFYFTPSIAPSDLAECSFKGLSNYELQPCLFISSLAQKAIFIIKLNKGDVSKVQSVEKIDTGKRVRKLFVVSENNLLFLTEDLRIFSLSFKEKATK